MSENLCEVVKKHHAFYEVLPYCVVLEERHGSPTALTRTIQAGFDVDIYGLSPRNDLMPPGPDLDYALGCLELQEMTKEILPQTGGSCSLEVTSFPLRVVLDARNHAVEGMLRIRISRRDLDQPVGLTEQEALKEVENRLRGLGVARR